MGETSEPPFDPELSAYLATMDRGVLRDLSRKVTEDVAGAVTRTMMLLSRREEMIMLAQAALIPIHAVAQALFSGRKDLTPEQARAVATAALVLQLRVHGGTSEAEAREECARTLAAAGVAEAAIVKIA